MYFPFLSLYEYIRLSARKIVRASLRDRQPGNSPWFCKEKDLNQDATLVGGIRGALWLPSYLRRDATALGLLLLSI